MDTVLSYRNLSEGGLNENSWRSDSLPLLPNFLDFLSELKYQPLNARMEETIHAWMTQNRENVEKIGLEVIDIREEFAILNIEGYRMQLIIPSAFHGPCPDNLKPDSSFMATLLEEQEDEALKEALIALNEKLEVVRIGPDCLTKVLNNILNVFRYYKCWAMYKLAECARVQCEEASDEHWCSVSVDPSSKTVVMEMETKGIIDSKNVARSLGFCFDSPLIISLGFSHLSPEEIFVDSFGNVHVSMKQTLHPQIEASMQTLTDPLDAEKLRNAVNKFCRTIICQYGLETLVKKKVEESFDICSERVNSADSTGLVGESDNILFRLLIYIRTYLKDINNSCVFCRKKLPSFSRWCWCDAKLCLFEFEEKGIGASILHELQNSELIELELSLAADAAKSDCDVFEPYPPFLLKTQEIRNRSEFGKENDNKNLHFLRSIIDSFPTVAEMQECTSDIVLMEKLGTSWLKHQCNSDNFEVDKFSEEDYAENVRLPYNVLRYVLYTNRLLMDLLQEDFRLNVPGSLYQFAVFYNSEREQSFKHRREREGSIFAFHGSASHNWYSIIRNGLRCLSIEDNMSSGTPYGQCIYLSTNMNEACSYSTPLSGWPNGKLKEYGVVALCEIFSGQWHFESESSLVVPPEKENDVVIRYLIVCKHEYVETGLLRETNFCDHYQQLRDYYSLLNLPALELS